MPIDVQERCISHLVGRQARLVSQCIGEEGQPHLPLDRISTMFRYLKAPPGQLPHTKTVEDLLPVLSQCLSKWQRIASNLIKFYKWTKSKLEWFLFFAFKFWARFRVSTALWRGSASACVSSFDFCRRTPARFWRRWRTRSWRSTRRTNTRAFSISPPSSSTKLARITVRSYRPCLKRWRLPPWHGWTRATDCARIRITWTTGADYLRAWPKRHPNTSTGAPPFKPLSTPPSPPRNSTIEMLPLPCTNSFYR